MGLDVANIGNDKMNAAKTPLHQGGAGRNKDRKKSEASLLQDVDFRGHGMSGGDFFSDLLSGLNTAAGVANTSLDLFDKTRKVLGNKGSGMSGGVRRGAEMSDVMAPQGRTGQMLAVAPIKKGSRKGSALLAGAGKLRGGERMTGDNYTPDWRTIEAEQAKSGFIGNGMSGGDFFSDLLGTVNNVAGAVGPIAGLLGKFGAGQSGGKKMSKATQKRLALRIAELQGRRGAGAGTYGQPALLGMEGSGPISDLGIPGLSQIAGLFGLGMSGGAANGAQDPAFRVPAPSSEALASAFLGGRHPSKVSKAEKKMLFLKALADAKMHHELGNMMQGMQGKGYSGGNELLTGLGLSGGDFFSDLLGTIGNVAGTAMKVAPLFGLGESGGGRRKRGGAFDPMGAGVSGGMVDKLKYPDYGMQGGDFFSDLLGTVGNVAGTALKVAPLFGLGESGGGMSGGGLTDMPSLNATASRHSYGNMGNIAGMANGAGRPPTNKKVKGGYLPAPPTQVGVSMSGMGQDSESEEESNYDSEEDMEGGEDLRQVGCGLSGGKMTWINHVKAYQRKHGCSYKDALKRAGASYRK